MQPSIRHYVPRTYSESADLIRTVIFSYASVEDSSGNSVHPNSNKSQRMKKGIATRYTSGQRFSSGTNHVSCSSNLHTAANLAVIAIIIIIIIKSNAEYTRHNTQRYRREPTAVATTDREQEHPKLWYQTIRRHIPDYCYHHTPHRENLRSDKGLRFPQR
jgi:hypothetical protein